MNCRLSGQHEMPDLPKAPAVTETDVDAVLHEFGGDARAAIRALLADLATLAYDQVTTVSLGFVRGEVMGGRLRRRGRR